jgi:hypothetical protein
MMSRNAFVAIVGNGKTTRSNVEALLSDFKDSVDSLTLIIHVKADLTTGVSEGVDFAKQYAEANSIPVVYSTDVYTHIEVELLSYLDDVKLFILWDDDDIACQEAVYFAQKHAVPVFDLADGLIRVATDNIKVDAPTEVTMPEVEVNVVDEPAPEPPKMFTKPKEPVFERPTLETEPIDEGEEFERFMSGDILVTALEEAGRIMAAAFTDELLRRLREDSGGKDE